MRLFFAAAVLALPTALHAEPMSLDDALRLAETRAPELQAREAGLDAARSAAIAADRLPDPKLNLAIRSEEHTSELQSLMRTSYAVFCLKKKNKTHPTR